MARLVNPMGTKRQTLTGRLRRAMSFYDLCSTVGGSSAEVPKGSSCIGNGAPLLALTVVPDAEFSSDYFAVVFSVSHTIIDGCTYYTLLAMLSAAGTPRALNPTRKPEIMETTKLFMGAAEETFANSGGIMCNVVGALLCGSKPTICNFFVDKARVAAEKAKPKQHGVDFVSTNDVLASSFANATSARIMLLPINFRGRKAEYTADDAGNYEGALVFGPEDYSDPCKIRKTLQSGPPTFLRGAGGVEVPSPLPGGCEAMRCALAMVTNWTFPCFQELAVDGCRHLLHTPHCDVKMVPFDVAVVYHPRKGELATVFFVRSIDEKGLKTELPLGEAVTVPT